MEDVGDPKLVSRAKRLARDRHRLGNEIYRKIQGALALRLAVAGSHGRADLDVYSGASMVMRCSDANPRRMIGIFNKLLQDGDWRTSGFGNAPDVKPISRSVQTRILRTFSVTTLSRVQSEPTFGPAMYGMIRTIGDYMHYMLHHALLTSDQVTSVEVDEHVDQTVWEIIKECVSIGLLYPNINYSHPDEMPERHGIFHLAYVLAPCFELLPRRGKSRSVYTVLNFSGAQHVEVQLPLGF